MQNTSIKRRVIGIDISSDRTTLAVVDVRGNIIAQSYFVTSSYPDINEFTARLTEEVIALAEANGGYENIRSLGITAAHYGPERICQFLTVYHHSGDSLDKGPYRKCYDALSYGDQRVLMLSEF